jgi:hypothetical protein
MKSMKDCKVQKEKDQLMRDTFINKGAEVNDDYHYKNARIKIPFIIVDLNNQYYGMNGSISWDCIQRGSSWDIRSFNKNDINKFIKKGLIIKG